MPGYTPRPAVKQFFTRYKRPRVDDFARFSDSIQIDFRRMLNDVRVYGIVRNYGSEFAVTVVDTAGALSVNLGTGLLYDDPANNGSADDIAQRVEVSDTNAFSSGNPYLTDTQPIPQSTPKSTGSQGMPLGMKLTGKDWVILMKYLETVDTSWPEYYVADRIHGYSKREDGYILKALQIDTSLGGYPTGAESAIATELGNGFIFLGVVTQEGNFLEEGYGYKRIYMEENKQSYHLRGYAGSGVYLKLESYIVGSETAEIVVHPVTAGSDVTFTVTGGASWTAQAFNLPEDLFQGHINTSGQVTITLRSKHATDDYPTAYCGWRNIRIGPINSSELVTYFSDFDTLLYNSYFGTYKSLGSYPTTNCTVAGWTVRTDTPGVDYNGGKVIVLETGTPIKTFVVTARKPASATVYGGIVINNVSLGYLDQIYADTGLMDASITLRKLASNINASGIGFDADKVDGKQASDFVWRDGTKLLTGDWIAGNATTNLYYIQARQLKSVIATVEGAPLTVLSTTRVDNLNSQYLSGSDLETVKSDARTKSAATLIVEARTSDPTSPANGTIWLRTDL